MARKDRTIPPVAIQLTDYDAQYMEQYHKQTYKSFLAMRQHITTEYNSRAARKIVDNITYYTYYNLENNIADGSYGYDLLRWHGMTEESIQEIINFHNSEDLDRLKLRWERRREFDSVLFQSIETTIQDIITVTHGTYFTGMLESDLTRTGVTTDDEIATWNIYFALNLLQITDDDGEARLVIDTVLRQEIIDAVESGDTRPPLIRGMPQYIIGGDMDRAKAGVAALNQGLTQLFYTPPPIEFFHNLIYQHTMLNKDAFDVISQDDFFDIYAENIFIDWKIDESWWERFIGGLLKFIGNLLNFVLDVLLNIPIFGVVLEWLVEGVASLFGMTLEEARAATIQAIVAIITLYFSIPSGGSSMYAYVQWVSSAYSLGGIAGDLAAATYESPVKKIEEAEEEELRRELEKMQHELNLVVGLEEPIIRLNRPEEELRVNGNNNSTYTIFKLD